MVIPLDGGDNIVSAAMYSGAALGWGLEVTWWFVVVVCLWTWGIGSGYALPLLPPTNHRRPLLVFVSGLISLLTRCVKLI